MPGASYNIGLALALALATPADAAIRTLFVGINDYATPDPAVKDLQGAVNDVMMIRKILGERWQIAMPPLDPKNACEARSADGVSVTLINACATRAQLLQALTEQIATAADGDTLLFYYAGHGAEVEDTSGTQRNRLSSTIVPSDARNGAVFDIVDIDLGRLIDAGVARGVNIVTIFDSCNSGTGTRDLNDLRAGQTRSVPAAAPAPAGTNSDIQPPAPRAHTTNAYRVHFAAAADGEVARELAVDGVQHGVFSLALQEALAGLDRPAYADILARIRSTLVTRRAGQSPDTRLAEQTVSGEGALQAPFLGLRPQQQRIVAARPGASPTKLALAAGTLSGVTIGSSYRLFGSTGAALRNSDMGLGNGIVTAASFDRAELTLASALEASASGSHGDTLQALEISHVANGAPVRLRIDGGNARDRAVISQSLGTAPSIAMVSDAPDYVLASEAGGWQLRGAFDSTAIGSPVDSAALATSLPETWRKLVQYFTLASLPGGSGSDGLAFSYDCIDQSYNPRLPLAAGEPQIRSGDMMSVKITNVADTPRYASLIILSPNLGIAPLGLENASDLVPPGETIRKRTLRATAVNRNQFLLLLTDQPIDTSVLRQDGARDFSGSTNSLQRLLAAARNGNGTRDIATVNSFVAQMTTVKVVPANAKIALPAGCQIKSP